MEKIKLTIITLISIIVIILIYSLSKSWFFFEKGVELNEEIVSSEEPVVKEIPKDSLIENANIIWKNFAYYPTDLSKEAGGIGSDGVMMHAKNLTFVNLTTGKVKRLFEKKVFIWDYFSGEYVKTYLKNNEERKDLLELSNTFLIFAITVDTNKDGFLNTKDKIRLFTYNPAEEELLDIYPEEYYYERLLFNTKKNILITIIKKFDEKKEDTKPVIYTYDVATKKGMIIQAE